MIFRTPDIPKILQMSRDSCGGFYGSWSVIVIFEES
jgi:hypothetical protein